MSKRVFKKWTLLLTLGLALHMSSAKAQTLPLGAYTYTSTNSAFEVDTNGLLTLTGNYTGSTGGLTLSYGVNGAGSRMFWYPQKAAFRAGYVSGTNWDDANIGLYSVAMGNNATASQIDSVALGYGTATAPGAVALGSGTASGIGAEAFGTGTANGYFSTAFGFGTTASGEWSTALGNAASAIGPGTIAGGYWTEAEGPFSTAFGYYTTTVAYYSTAFGVHTTGSAYADFVIGQYNTGANEVPLTSVNVSSWISSDPVFEIGNGTGTGTSASDAVVVYKDGTSTFQQPITVVNPSPDIPMFSN